MAKVRISTEVAGTLPVTEWFIVQKAARLPS